MGDTGSPSSLADLLAASQPATERDVHLARMLLKQTGKHIEARVSGTSMGDTLPIGSRIRIRHCDERALRPGQIVAFLAGNRIAVHRIIYAGTRGAAQGFLITQGDGDWLCDPPIALDRVAGCVEEFCHDAQWRPIGPRAPSTLRRIVSMPMRIVLRLALEASPTFALALGRGISRLRMMVRSLLSRVRSTRPGNVRN